MTVRQRIVLLVALSLVALLATGIYAIYKSSASALDVRRVTEGVVPSSAKSVALIGQLKDVHLSALDIVNAAPDVDVEAASKKVQQRKLELTQALDDQLASADTQVQRGLVGVAKEGLVEYFASIDDAVALRRSGQAELAAAQLAATATQYLREQGEAMEALRTEKTRAKDEALAALNARLDRTKVTLTAISIVSVLSLAGVGLVLYRQIVGPLGEMQRKMTHIAQTQDYDSRLVVARDDEIGKSMQAFNAMIEKIQHSNALVRQKSADIHAMLHAIPQGILTIEAGGRVHPEYSAHLPAILGDADIAGRQVLALVFERSSLGADALSQVDAALGAILGEDAMNFEFNAHLLPTEITRASVGGAGGGDGGDRRILDLHWAPMPGDDGTVRRLLLCIRDVTELRRLEHEAAAGRRELAIVGEILGISQEKFAAFAESAQGLVAANVALLGAAAAQAGSAARPAAVQELFRNMHTVKGNARTLGLRHLSDAAHGVEETYAALRAGTLEWDQPQLERELDGVVAALAEYTRINDDKLGRRGPGRRGDPDRFHLVAREQVARLLAAVRGADRADVAALGSTLDQLEAELATVGTERLDDALAAVIDGLPALTDRLGKTAPVVRIDDGGVRIRTQSAGVLRNAFVHLMRNALDHGLETAAERRARGKAERGTLTLSAALHGGRLRLALQDDGRGLALRALRDKALAAGQFDDTRAWSDAELAELAFRPGLSTAAEVSDVSGRGVGMDAVRAFVVAEGGAIALELTGPTGADGCAPFRVVIDLPGSCAVATAARHTAAEASHV